MSSIKITC